MLPKLFVDLFNRECDVSLDCETLPDTVNVYESTVVFDLQLG